MSKKFDPSEYYSDIASEVIGFPRVVDFFAKVLKIQPADKLALICNLNSLAKILDKEGWDLFRDMRREDDAIIFGDDCPEEVKEAVRAMLAIEFEDLKPAGRACQIYLKCREAFGKFYGCGE